MLRFLFHENCVWRVRPVGITGGTKILARVQCSSCEIHTIICSTKYIINLTTPWRTVLSEVLTVSLLVKKVPELYGNQYSFNAHTPFRHLSLSWARPIQSMPPHPTSWCSISILFSHLCLGLSSGIFSSGFPKNILYAPLLSPYVLNASPTSFFSS